MNKDAIVRFAPSPTGGLHLGGVRTVLYNYLFAKQNQGVFILRIEDTDRNRYVAGAEEYIFECLKWCGLQPDESVEHPGEHGPYRQSERKEIYRQYAEQLIASGHAYYAFDTPAELDAMRERLTTTENPNPQYDHTTRMHMRNSLVLSKEETDDLLNKNEPHVIRIKMPEHETVTFTDMIRGEVHFEAGISDDKVLLKGDGMPTYHLAVVVDDYLMKITHAFRGEEWLPSAPVHILLWRYLGWRDKMPKWAHFPLILGPEGKLSKRDGAKYGFPVYAMNWKDPETGTLTEGFREKGFLPEAFINLLALLGWNDGTDKEIYTLNELVESFNIDRVHKGGAHFDYEKAKWFNHEWIKRSTAQRLLPDVKNVLTNNKIHIPDDEKLVRIIELVKERCSLLTDFYDQTKFFFITPVEIDTASVQPKWSEAKKEFFEEFVQKVAGADSMDAADIENVFKQLAQEKNIKPGELQLPLRIILVGGKFGPPVFDIATLIGKEEMIKRISYTLNLLK